VPDDQDPWHLHIYTFSYTLDTEAFIWIDIIHHEEMQERMKAAGFEGTNPVIILQSTGCYKSQMKSFRKYAHPDNYIEKHGKYLNKGGIKMNLSFIVTILICLMSASATAQPLNLSHLTPMKRLFAVENYALAFMEQRSESSNARIQVTLSHDGVNWYDTHFPVLNEVQLKETSGVGICGSPDGRKLMVVFNAKPQTVHIVEGLVTDINVSWSAPSTMVPSPNVDSAPSCVFLQDDIRVIGYRSGSQMVAQMYVGGDSFIASAIPPLFNNYSVGHPVIATDSGITIMAWVQRPPDGICTSVYMAQGQMVQAGPFSTFSFGLSGKLNLTDIGVSPCASSDPALATDGKNFYLAVVQEQTSAGPGTLHSWEVVEYKSLGSDLYSGWAEIGRISLSPSNRTYINLAATQVGTRLAAEIKDRPTGPNQIESILYSGGAWQTLLTGGAPWLNASGASYRAFGLTRFGINAPLPSINGIPGLTPGIYKPKQ
jgi:hypothetical protein